MHWVTTRGVRINRAATAWLIRRFIDPQASFVFTAAGEVAEIARALAGVGFHAPGTPYPARDPQGRTPFEALVAERCPDDEVLAEMAVIVRHADAHPRRRCPRRRACGSSPAPSPSSPATTTRRSSARPSSTTPSTPASRRGRGGGGRRALTGEPCLGD